MESSQNNPATRIMCLYQTLSLQSASVAMLAEKYHVNTRTIQRDINLLKGLGLNIIKLGTYYHIEGYSTSHRQDVDLAQFSHECITAAYQIINQLDIKLSQKEELVAQLDTIGDYFIHLQQLVDYHIVKLAEQLELCIKQGLQVRLLGYCSAHSNSCRDREVEPFQLTDDHHYVWCFDLEDLQCKIFKLDRIAGLAVTNCKFQHASMHQVLDIDPFHITIKEPHSVKLRLTMRAANLLKEEYPTANVVPQEDYYLLHTIVGDFSGIGRFILGLPHDVEILESPAAEALRAYLKTEAEQLLQKLAVSDATCRSAVNIVEDNNIR